MSESEELPDTLTLTPHVEESQLPPWGRLIPRRTYLLTVDLLKDKYVLGRKNCCDILIDGSRMEPDKLNYISKEHFIITRDLTLVPYIRDLSKNGTYLNGSLIGMKNAMSLCDGDIISVGHPRVEMYQFRDDILNNVSPDFDRKYRLTRTLGTGAFGQVYLAYSKETSQRFAVKKMNLSDRDRTKICNEIKILERLNHPCVIKMYEAVYSRNKNVFIVLEYMEGGELQSRVLRQSYLTESVAKLYMYQMAMAIRYLHNCGITHRDLKPENVLLANNAQITRIKVTDFGLSKVLGESLMMRTLCGTPLYVAPEILQVDNPTKAYTQLVDIWSLGCVLYFTLYGHTPFQESTDTERNDEEELNTDDGTLKSLYWKIIRGKFTLPQRNENCSCSEGGAVDLICKMLVVDPKKRITVDDLLEHSWFADAVMISNLATVLTTSD